MVSNSERKKVVIAKKEQEGKGHSYAELSPIGTVKKNKDEKMVSGS